MGRKAMTRYQLAKLVQWAEKLESRKRMQKVVFLLQAAGFPGEADYGLHYFGPYSADVAHLTDEMTQAELLQEEEKSVGQGRTYNYCLAPKAKTILPEFERSDEGQKRLTEVQPFESLARNLLGRNLKDLEHAATLVYFHKRSKLPWPDAMEQTCKMKKIRKNSAALRRAEELAREILSESR